ARAPRLDADRCVHALDGARQSASVDGSLHLREVGLLDPTREVLHVDAVEVPSDPEGPLVVRSRFVALAAQAAAVATDEVGLGELPGDVGHRHAEGRRRRDVALRGREVADLDRDERAADERISSMLLVAHDHDPEALARLARTALARRLDALL